MEKSTILGIGLLSVVGVGAYIYLKGKKSTTPISSSPISTNTTTNTASESSSTVNSSMGSPTSSVVNSSLGLPTTSSPISEEQKKYLEAKDLARLLFLNYSKLENDEFKLLSAKYELYSNSWVDSNKITVIAPQRISALGYKLLPNYDIENTKTTTKTPEQKNYLEAKDLARILLLYNAKLENDEFKLLTSYYGVNVGAFMKPSIPSVVSSKINALGYKVLPNYDIEKM